MPEKYDETYWVFEKRIRNGYTFKSQLPILSKRINWIKKYVEGAGLHQVRVLDIGCGFGYFLKLCDSEGWETYGMDTSDFAIKIARKNTRAQLHRGNIEDWSFGIFEENYFDLVSMFDVLEHLTQPTIALKKTYKLLKPRGKLWITTPNLNAIMRILSRFFKRERDWYGFLDETHVNFFKPSLLRRFVEEFGFRVLEVKTPFYKLPWYFNSVLGKVGLGGQILLLAEKKT